MHFVYENVNQFYSFKGLHEFKEKFHPAWSPRYLVYPSTADLPNAALALTKISSGDGFLTEAAKDFVRQVVAKRKENRLAKIQAKEPTEPTSTDPGIEPS